MTLDLIHIHVQGTDEPSMLNPNTISRWKQTYAEMDVAEQLEKAQAYFTDNPDKRKAANEIEGYLEGWMKRAYLKGGYTPQETFCYRCWNNGVEYAIREEYGGHWATTTTPCNNVRCKFYSEDVKVRKPTNLKTTHIFSTEQLQQMKEGCDTFTFHGRSYQATGMGPMILDVIVRHLNDPENF